MILFSSIIQTFETRFVEQFRDRILPSHRKAMAAMKNCRTQHSPRMRADCSECDQTRHIPHSCGHRNCPHCQAHESQQWLQRQLQKQVPAEYFLLTFTLPAQFRSLAWRHQRRIYSAMISCCWDTIRTFSQNHRQLQGTPGAIAVLHTHARNLGFHPHVHLMVPAAAIDPVKGLWRTKTGPGYLFNHTALAKVFRAKMLDAISREGLDLPRNHPVKWVVDCKSVGSGEQALTYLGRYLYRGVIQEKDIVDCSDGNVTYRFQNSKTRRMEYRTISGEKFLWRVLQHIPPRGFRRARNFGFLHPNSKRLIRLLQYLGKLDPNRALAALTKRPQLICSGCGAVMKIVKTQITPLFTGITPAPT